MYFSVITNETLRVQTLVELLSNGQLASRHGYVIKANFRTQLLIFFCDIGNESLHEFKLD